MPPPKPEHGKVNITKLKTDIGIVYEARYDCDYEYGLQGPKIQRCSSGYAKANQWTLSAPKCLGKCQDIAIHLYNVWILTNFNSPFTYCL